MPRSTEWPWLAGCLLALAASFAHAQHAPPARVRAASVDRETVWRADFDTLATRIRRWHPRPFGICPEARFDSAVTAIRGEPCSPVGP